MLAGTNSTTTTTGWKSSSFYNWKLSLWNADTVMAFRLPQICIGRCLPSRTKGANVSCLLFVHNTASLSGIHLSMRIGSRICWITLQRVGGTGIQHPSISISFGANSNKCCGAAALLLFRQVPTDAVYAQHVLSRNHIAGAHIHIPWHYEIGGAPQLLEHSIQGNRLKGKNSISRGTANSI